MSKLTWSTICLACSVFFVTSVQAMDNQKTTAPQQTNQELIDNARARVIASLHELKDIMSTRSAREPGMCPQGQCYPTCPQQIDPILEQIRCILCSMKCKGMCEIDHIEEWIALIEAIACHPVPSPKLPENVCAALAQLADGLTELLHRVGCGECEISMPDDILGRLCFIASQIEVIDDKVDNLGCNIGRLDCEIANLTDKVDDISCDVSEFDHTLGTRYQTVDCSIIEETDCNTIMSMDLSVIQWLKAIFAKVK